MRDLEEYEIKILLQMYDKGIIGPSNYVGIKKAQRMIKWDKIARQYNIKRNFSSTVRKLVARQLLSDGGKSMNVLYLTQLGAVFVMSHLQDRGHNP